MAKISTLVDAFTGSSVNTAVWNGSTAGQFTLDTVNDCVTVNVGTTAGTVNILGANGPYDATESVLTAQVTPAPNGNGTTQTILKIAKDASNSVAMRLQSGVFVVTRQTAGVTITQTLAPYDAHRHRWWRISETGGAFTAYGSPDGLNWAILGGALRLWDGTACTVSFQTGVSGTEPAGMVATIAHVNTRAGGVANPNWPTVEHGAGLLWDANAAASPLDLYVDVTARTRGQVSVSRGRQYELDAVRAGEENTSLANTDGALNPESVASLFAGYVQPFQPYRVRAQWPPTTNLLSQGIASGGTWGGVTTGTITPTAALDLLSDTDTTGGSVVTSTSAWIGGTVFQFAVPNATPAGQLIARTAQVASAPGQSYTVQMRVRNVTASTTLQVQAFIGWYSPGSAGASFSFTGTSTTLTGSASAGWSTLTVSGKTPLNALGMVVGVATAATAAAACAVQVDGAQLEKAASASAWVMPGVWYPLYAGFTEDWASQWDMGGTYGTITPTTADAFSLLSQLELAGPLTEEIDAHNPTYLYRLDDPAGSAGATDLIGAYPLAPTMNGKFGAGVFTFGTDIAAATPAGLYTGSTGTVATLANANSGTASASATTFLSLTAAGIRGPVTGTYSRVIAFRYTGPTPTSAADIWTAMDNNHGGSPGGMLRLYIDTAGKLNAVMRSVSAGALTLTSTAAVNDGQWHLAVFGASPGASGIFFLSLDGAYTSTGPTTGFFPTGVVCDSVGAQVDAVLGNSTKFTFSGQISFVGEFPTVLTTTDCTNLYGAWRSACAGESTDARYARILRYAGYTGPASIQAGMTTSMGPAAIDGQDVVSALQAVVDTENGEHFIDGTGAPTFRSRAARYNATTPAVSFGEVAALSEWPYEDIKTVWDSTHLGNKITVTQESTGQTFPARSKPSMTTYFPRTITPRTINSSSTLECQDAANYLVGRYAQPLTRITSLVLHPSANPAMWPTCLALELGTRARVIRRPPAPAPPSTIECFIENVNWSMDGTGEALLTLQCSPAATAQYVIFSAWHTTLASASTSGSSAITVNASADNTNPLDAQLLAGTQLVLGQNTANQETVTVLAVGASTPGWATAILNLTAPTTKNHSTGDIVCEPLPAGVTDPSTSDAASAFDATAFAY